MHAGERGERHRMLEHAARFHGLERVVGGIGVGGDHAPGKTRRARRVEDVGDVVVADVDRGRRRVAARRLHLPYAAGLQHQPRRAVGDDVLELALGVARVDGHGRGAGAVGGDVAHGELDGVGGGHQQAYPVALLDAVRHQAAGYGVGPLVPGPVRELATAVDDDGNAVAEALCSFGQLPRDVHALIIVCRR